jgi:ATP-binding cassette subfamily F protein 3
LAGTETGPTEICQKTKKLTADSYKKMIAFSNVHKSFAKQDLLVDCSFQVNSGERVGIIGANGTGKSTVFKLLLDLEHPDRGQISKPKNLRLGYLPQDVLQFRGKTVLAQVLDVAAEVLAIEAELSLLADQLERPLPEAELAKAAKRQSRLLEDFQRLGGYATTLTPGLARCSLASASVRRICSGRLKR